jgi:hypothetical protein
LAENTYDPIDKAEVLLHAPKTLQLLERYADARFQLNAAWALVRCIYQALVLKS